MPITPSPASPSTTTALAASLTAAFINFTGPSQSLATTVTVASASSVQLICKDIPEGGGVANINWNP